MSAARTAISAVSGSRISPTMTTSGSERRIVRRPAANVSPISGVDGDLREPVHPVLDGVLDRDDLARRLVDALQRRVERRRLARARRPGDQDAPYGLCEHPAELRRVGLATDRGRRACGTTIAAVQHADDDALAHSGVGSVATRRSSGSPSMRERDAAVLRAAPLGDVHVGHDLDAAGEPGLRALGQRSHVLKHAVDAVADAHAGPLPARSGCRSPGQRRPRGGAG